MLRYWCLGAVLVVTAVAGAQSAPAYESQPSPLHIQLDRYLAGEFEAVVGEIAARRNFDGLLDELRRDAPAWIGAGGSADRSKRTLAAASLALEAVRAAEDEDWKWIQNNRLGPDPKSQVEGGKYLPSTYRPQPAILWKTPPLLLEWACAVVREGGLQPSVERAWHLAAIAVAQRRSDFEFLLGNPWELRENPKDEIEHLAHVAARFPDEPRFALAQAIAMEWRTWPLSAKHPRTAAINLPDAMRAFERQVDDPAIGAEATLRLGALRLRARNPGGALDLFARVETRTRDRHLIYLARFFAGQARERQNRLADAELAYRGALATIPGGISATMALSAVLVRAGRISEASALVEEATTVAPPVVDPWRIYATADDRFWPALLARVRAAIAPAGSGPSKSEGPYVRPTEAPEEPGSGPSEGEGPYVRQQQPQQPVFRGRTDLVTIDVSVRSQGTPVAGLTAKDFVLLDNGVAQTVEQISMEAVPVDVTILIDLNEDLADDLRGMSAQIPRIVAMLRPDDRVRVTAINTHVTDLIRVQTAAEVPALGPLRPAGLSSAHDGLAAALLRRVDPNRRHLVIALTNGVDAVSALDARAVRDIARYSTATLHLAQVDVALDPNPGSTAYLSGRQRRDRERCAASGVCSPTKRFWQPYGDYEFETLAEAAALTGGKLYLPGVFTDRTAAAIFKNVFEDYRRSYLLRYTPQGTPSPGWHEVTVTIPSYPSYDVEARRGYFVEVSGGVGGATPSGGAPGATPHDTAGPTPPPGARPARSDAATIDDLIAAYTREDYAAFVNWLWRSGNVETLIKDFRDRGNPWPNAPMREAIFALELADAGVQSRRPGDQDAARRLMLDYAPLVRDPFGPGPYERYWLWASILTLQGANQPPAALRMIDLALERFPDEPRFLLARAFVLDQRRPLQTLTRNKVLLSTVTSHVAEVSAAYEAAMASPETVAEARLRLGWLLHRAGRHDEALARFDDAGAPQEALLAYLTHLMRGHALTALERTEAAADAYRAALVLAPDAQSARVGLMAALQRLGDRDAALQLAEQVQRASPDAADPWWLYWQGDYRLRPTVFTRLRGYGQ